jgi:hypothetical protein
MALHHGSRLVHAAPWISACACGETDLTQPDWCLHAQSTERLRDFGLAATHERATLLYRERWGNPTLADDVRPRMACHGCSRGCSGRSNHCPSLHALVLFIAAIAPGWGVQTSLKRLGSRYVASEGRQDSSRTDPRVWVLPWRRPGIGGRTQSSVFGKIAVCAKIAASAISTYRGDGVRRKPPLGLMTPTITLLEWVRS